MIVSSTTIQVSCQGKITRNIFFFHLLNTFYSIFLDRKRRSIWTDSHEKIFKWKFESFKIVAFFWFGEFQIPSTYNYRSIFLPFRSPFGLQMLSLILATASKGRSRSNNQQSSRYDRQFPFSAIQSAVNGLRIASQFMTEACFCHATNSTEIWHVDLPMLSALKLLSNATCFAGPHSITRLLVVIVSLKSVPLDRASQLRVRKSWDLEAPRLLGTAPIWQENPKYVRNLQ